MSFALPVNPRFTTPDTIAQINENPGFGAAFTDHMAVAQWTDGKGWHDDRIESYSKMGLDPANAVFHYAQEIFEGLKAYHRADGSIWLFRPDANAKRMQNSAIRLALPELPVEDFLTSVRNLVKIDARWTPTKDEQSLYLRPFMFANENFLGVRASKSVTYVCIASPVGAYFKEGVKPIDIMVTTEYSRAGVGGTGAAKCGGNYASSLLPQQIAYEQGCSQVLFTDGAHHEYIEELGGMNFFIVTKDDELVTPELNGNILAGVTRDSLLKLAGRVGLNAVERPVSLEEVFKGSYDGSIIEAFACGTAAVVSPIRSLKHDTRTYEFASTTNAKAMELRALLLDIQYGRAEDPFGWTERVC
jgi:branched-chain amino acid aminotransferase